MMHQPHKIAEVVFNIAFATHNQVMQGAASLPGLIQNRLAMCMDDILEECATDQEVVSIDRLDVDLGVVAYDDLEAVLSDRLRQALRAAMQTGKTVRRTTGPDTVRRISPQQAGLDLIAHYLVNGTLPWTAEKALQTEISAILDDLMDQAPQALIAYLREHAGVGSPVLSRLARQFKPDLLLRLVARLAPRRVAGIDQYVTALRALHESLALLPVSEHEFIGLVWETILRQLLSPGDISQTPCSLVASALTSAAGWLRVPPTVLHRRLKDAWPNNHANPDRFSANLLNVIAANSAPHLSPQPPPDAWPALRSALLGAIIHHRMDGFEKAWRRMSIGFPEPTLSTIRQYARQARVQRAIARQFSQQQFQELVVLIQPQHAAFIAKVMEHHTTIRQVLPESPGNSEKVGRHLREFTLAYLLADSASRFNRKQYCAGVIRQLAARHNMKYRELLAGLHTFFTRTISTADPTGRQLREILAEISDEENKTALPAHLQNLDDGGSAPSLKMDTINRFQYFLEYCLRYGAMPTGGALSSAPSDPIPMLTELAENQPDRLVGLLQDLYARDSLALRRWLAGLPAAQLQALVGCALTARQLSRPNDSALATWAREHARPSNHPFDRYWARLLEDLIEAPGPTAEDAPTLLIQSQTLAAGDLALSQNIDLITRFQYVPEYYLAHGSMPPGGRHAFGPPHLSIMLNKLVEDQPDRLVGLLHDLCARDSRALRRWLVGLPAAQLQALVGCALTARQMSRPNDSALAAWAREHARPFNHLFDRYWARLLEDLIEAPGPTAEDAPALLIQSQTLAAGDLALSQNLDLITRFQYVLEYYLAHGSMPPGGRHAFGPPHLSTMLNKLVEDQPDRLVGLLHDLCARDSRALRRWLAGLPAAQLLALVGCVFATRQPVKKNAVISDAPGRFASGARLTLKQPKKTPPAIAEKQVEPVTAEEQTSPAESVCVENSGMVLAAPFLPRLFDMLGLLEKSRFKDQGAAERAVHLLEYLVNERTVAPEFQLALNKALCGLTSAIPIVSGIDISSEEIESINSLIQGMISHWKILGNTSPEGLRTSFLQRRGYLNLKDDAWHLQVEACAFDMLLEQLPWSTAMVKHPWMNRVLHVNWR